MFTSNASIRACLRVTSAATRWRKSIPQELAQIEQGQTERKQDPAALRRRQRIFVPVAAVITVVLLVGLYLFVTYEQTAISTVLRQDIEVFVPQTPEVAPAP